jgi:hypothetical protein
MNLGVAVEDTVTAKALFDRARERGAGTRLPLSPSASGAGGVAGAGILPS